MKKSKIFIWHLLSFILGSIGIVFYVFYKLGGIKGGAGIGALIAMPIIMLVYVVGFSILCLISAGIFYLFWFFGKKKDRK